MGFAEMGICVENVHVLKPACKFTLAMLADRADPFDDPQKTIRRTDGRVVCWPSVQDLAYRTGQSRSTVLRQLKELENLGIIEIQRRWIRNGKGQARQTTSQYIINLPAMIAGEFQAPRQGKRVNLRPLPEDSKTAGQSKSVKLTPKQSKGVKKGKSKSVNSDTPYNYQGLTTIPSPPSPPGEGVESDEDAITEKGSAVPRGSESADSQGRGEISPESGTGSCLANGSATSQEPASGGDSDVAVAIGAEVEHVAQQAPTDADLIAAVLPEPMQAVPERDHARIARAIRERLNSGWTCEQMHALLVSRDLPEHVMHMTALVMARFRDDMPADTPPAWTASPSAASQSRPWSKTLPSGRVINASNLDMGQVAIDHLAAKAAGHDYAQGSRFAFLNAVDVTTYLTS